MSVLGEIKSSFKQGSVLTRLIYINLAVFIVIRLAQVFFFLSGKEFTWIEWLALPDSPQLFFQRPWTIITYMFLHYNFIHILFNILGLFWFGKMFMYRFEGGKLLSLYVLGGIAGGVLYMLSYNLFPVFSKENALLLGASASIFAILVALAAYEPNEEIYLALIGPVRMKYVAGFYLLLSVVGISASNPGGNIAHVGGALWGFLYISQLRRGKDMASWFDYLLKKLAFLFKRRQRIKISYKQPPRDDHEYNRQKNMNQEEINKILDKISKSGYQSLSKEEKELLFKQGKG
jgi:membrane associated rhomboid family serine protease